ncbi:MAG TPA: response regulator transcription factor [Gemmatimonadaceae bacterium]|nr:response regulator transcription factor [Gemmatimonadaceae bacterium]
MTRVLVAAASAVTRAGLEAILAREPAFSVVGRAATASLMDELTEHEPEVVLLELATVDEETLALLHTLGVDSDDGARHSPALVVLSDERDPANVAELLQAGGRAILPRDAGAAEIIAAVSAAAAGLVVVAREWSAVLRGAIGVERGAPDDGEALTPREIEVLRLIAEGLGNKQIAARLAISEHTVKFHVGSVFAKIRASTRAEAVVIGARRGLIVL